MCSFLPPSHTQALSVSISRDRRGCLILTQARATAQASCGPNGAFAQASTEVTRQVLGACGLQPLFNINFPQINLGTGRKLAQGNSGNNGNGRGPPFGFGNNNGNNSNGGGGAAASDAESRVRSNPSGLDIAAFTIDTVANALTSVSRGGNTRAAGEAAASAAGQDAGKTGLALAQAAVTSVSQGDPSAFANAAAQAFAVSSNRGNQQQFATAFATASTTAATRNTQATATALAQTAVQSRQQGVLDAFAQSQAIAFGTAKQQGSIDAFATAVAQAITQGGGTTADAYATAFAQAAANGGDQQEGLVQAIAAVSCKGGSQAQAFAQVGALEHASSRPAGSSKGTPVMVLWYATVASASVL